jgi:hypothetical protein
MLNHFIYVKANKKLPTAQKSTILDANTILVYYPLKQKLDSKLGLK